MANGYMNQGFGRPMGYGPGFAPMPGDFTGSPYYSPFWWGAPAGWTDVDLYDYNNNFILDDEEMADVVRDNIQADPFIPPSDANSIIIDIRDGVVTLSGTVRNPRSKPLSFADAFWSSGVVDVVSDVEIWPMKKRGAREQAVQPRRRMRAGRPVSARSKRGGREAAVASQIRRK